MRRTSIMKIIYVDECGPLKGWDSEKSNQPCLSIGAISVDANIYTSAIEELKTKIDSLSIAHIDTDKLGKGYEIKAKDILASSGFWKNHPNQRNELLKLTLGFPEQVKGVGWCVVIDFKKHKEKYVYPAEPFNIAMRFLFERIQIYAEQINEDVVVVYDQYKAADDDVHEAFVDLVTHHSIFEVMNGLSVLKFDRIIEMHLGNSKNSIGLQIADYFATFGYQIHKNNSIALSNKDLFLKYLYKGKLNEVHGSGYKIFPD